MDNLGTHYDKFTLYHTHHGPLTKARRGGRHGMVGTIGQQDVHDVHLYRYPVPKPRLLIETHGIHMIPCPDCGGFGAKSVRSRDVRESEAAPTAPNKTTVMHCERKMSCGLDRCMARALSHSPQYHYQLTKWNKKGAKDPPGKRAKMHQRADAKHGGIYV